MSAPHMNDSGKYPPPGYTAQPTGYPQSQSETVVVVQQPQTIVQATPQPNDYMVLSIITCLFCFWPVGIAAIIFSMKSKTAYSEGDLEGATQKGRTAKNLAIAALVIGLILIVIIGVIRGIAIAQYSS